MQRELALNSFVLPIGFFGLLLGERPHLELALIWEKHEQEVRCILDLPISSSHQCCPISGQLLVDVKLRSEFVQPFRDDASTRLTLNSKRVTFGVFERKRGILKAVEPSALTFARLESLTDRSVD